MAKSPAWTRKEGKSESGGLNAGSVVIREGGASGKILITVNTAASSTAGYTILPMPGEGILCESDLHGTVTNTTSMTLIDG